MLCDTDVVVEYKSASSSRRQSVLVPAHDTYTSVVPEHTSKLCALVHVPDLDLTGPESDADIRTIVGPLDTADVRVCGAFEQRFNRAGFSGPNVDAALETDGDLVL